MPHPPLYRRGSNWAVNRSAIALCKHARADQHRHGPLHNWYCTWYPGAAAERLSMVLFLVTQARWNDIHFLPQWALIRSAALQMPGLVERGFVGSVCDAMPLFELWRESESDDERAKRDAKALTNDSAIRKARINSKRRANCTSTKGVCSSSLLVPEPTEWQVAQIRAHYAQDYACLGNVLRTCVPPKGDPRITPPTATPTPTPDAQSNGQR